MAAKWTVQDAMDNNELGEVFVLQQRFVPKCEHTTPVQNPTPAFVFDGAAKRLKIELWCATCGEVYGTTPTRPFEELSPRLAMERKEILAKTGRL